MEFRYDLQLCYDGERLQFDKDEVHFGDLHVLASEQVTQFLAQILTDDEDFKVLDCNFNAPYKYLKISTNNKIETLNFQSSADTYFGYDIKTRGGKTLSISEDLYFLLFTFAYTRLAESKFDLNAIDIIRLSDYSDYDPDLANDGGKYAFWTDYRRFKNDWIVEYGTTADFDYCPICGTFATHYDDSGEYVCGDAGIVSTDKLRGIIREFRAEHKNDASYSIQFNIPRSWNEIVADDAAAAGIKTAFKIDAF